MGGQFIYHKVTRLDCLGVATREEKQRLNYIDDITLLKTLALKWCNKNGFKLGGYLGDSKWDATQIREP